MMERSEEQRPGPLASVIRLARRESQQISLRNSIACFVTGDTEQLRSEAMAEHWRAETRMYATSHQTALKNKMAAFELSI